MPDRRRPSIVGLGLTTAVLGMSLIVWAWSTRNDREVDRAPITPSSIVMLGDSITEQGPWSTAFGGRQIANRGYAGFTTAQLIDVARDVAMSQPSAVFVLTGTNDIRDGHPPDWTAERLGRILDEFERFAPETTVVVQTILPRGDHPASVQAANEAITRLADRRGVAVLDLYPAFDDGNGALRAVDTTDGLHLSDAGNDRWADLLDAAFDQLG